MNALDSRLRGNDEVAQTLAGLWQLAGLPQEALEYGELTGSDPVFPSTFAVGAAAQSTIAAAALAACGRPAELPNFYPQRMRALPELGEAASAAGLALCTGRALPGDVVLVRIGPCQFHLAVAVGGGEFVHANAGLKRVVRSCLPIAWHVIQHWRLAAKT